MDRARDLARRAGHAPVGDERDAVAAVLQNAQRRSELVQFGHAVRARALEAHHDDDVAVELARDERRLYRLLVVEHAGRSLDRPALALDRRHLDARPPEIAGQDAESAFRRERRGGRAHDGLVAARAGIGPVERIAVEPRLAAIVGEVAPRHGHQVAVQQSRIDQRADDERHAARLLERVHVGRSVRIDARDQRNGARQPVEIVPVEQDPGARRDRGQVQQMVGRPAGGEQTDARVDDGLLVDARAERAVVVAVPADLRQPLHRRPREFLPQLRAGIDERRARHVQTHHLHHHLVGVGGTVEGAGALRMIGPDLRFEQRRATDQPLGERFADRRLVLVRQPRTHRPGRHQHHRQMPETQRAHQQPRHDLVADAEQGRALEHAVAERDRRRQRDRVAAEQRQLHAGISLRHAVAHRRHAARDLRRRADRARPQLHLLGVAIVRRVRRQHVVVRRDDRDVHRAAIAQDVAILGGSGIGMGGVGAAHRRPMRSR